MKSLLKLFRGHASSTHRGRKPRRSGIRLELLESRQLMAADTTLPVLMVIADSHHFYYQEYNDTRVSLEAAGLEVQVAATTTNPSTPHWNSGQGLSDGVVVPDLALSDVNSSDYSAIVFVGGWGASMYQYAFPGDYANNHYDGDLATKATVNTLINEFLDSDKFVAAICHATSVLAWARVDGVSPIDGLQVSVPYIGSPAVLYEGVWYGDMALGQYEQAVANGAIANTASGQYGNPATATDDVVVSGQVITAENWDSALYFGQVIAEQVIAAANVEVPPVVNSAPVASDAAWIIAEHTAQGTSVGSVLAVDADAGQNLTYSIVGGNSGNAFSINPLTGEISVALSNAVNYETNPVFQLIVEVTDNGTPALSDTAIITIELTDIVEAPPVSVHRHGDDLIVQGSAGADLIYIWSGRQANQVFVWMNGVSYGSHTLVNGGKTIVYAGDGNDQIAATDLRSSVHIYGEGGHDLVTGGSANDLLDGGDGVDRLFAGPGNDLVRGGNGGDVIGGGEGNDILFGEAGDDVIVGGGGRDAIFGGAGEDYLVANFAEDLCSYGDFTGDEDEEELLAILAGGMHEFPWQVG